VTDSRFRRPICPKSCRCMSPFSFQKKDLGGAYVSVSARHAPASPGEACAGGAHSHMGSIHSRRCGSRAQASFTTTPPSTLVRCRSACPRKCIEVAGWPAAAVARPFRMRSPASLDASVAPTAGPAWRCPAPPRSAHPPAPPVPPPGLALGLSVCRSPSPDSRISFWASIMQVALKPVRTADANRKARARIKLRRARR
jgi:hypothetical protein